MSEKKKVIIVGAGVSGLSSGIYAQLNGFDTQIIEKHYISGGMCTAWYRKSYRFDYCIQWLAGSRYGTFYETYKETNVINDDVEVLNMDFHNRNISEDGSDMIVYTDLDRWQKYLNEISPEDKKSIAKMCRDIRWCCYLRPFDLAPPLRSIWDYIKSFFVCFPALYMVLKHRNKNYSQYIRSLKFKNKNLETKLINIYGECDFAAYAFLLIMSWYTKKNAGYPIGGSLEVAKRMQSRFEEYGGKMLFKKEVKEILIENGKAVGVELADGTVLKADYVISATDTYTTMYKLLKGKFVTDEFKKAFSDWSLFSSFVQVSFGINKKLDTDYPVQVVLAKGKKIGSSVLDHSYRILNYNFDKTMAPENKTCIIFRFDSPYTQWKDLSREEYLEEKKRIEEDVKELLEFHYPGSSEYIEVSDVATPLTTIRYTGAWKGAYEGFRPSSKNVIKQLKQNLPKLENFYMASQWLFPGGGIPPSVQSGKWAIQVICDKEKKKFIAKK